MNDITALIWLTHPTATADAISAYNDGASLDEAAADLMAALYIDDTFNGYTDAELQAAATEAITEY